MDVVKEFMAVRKLEWAGNPNIPRTDLAERPKTFGDMGPAAAAVDAGKVSKNKLKKMLKDQQVAEKKAQKEKEKAEAQGVTTEAPAEAS